ncbi:MAG: hypothetical protein ACAH17_00980, partial [Candidatus Paceibacterota bacterium]
KFKALKLVYTLTLLPLMNAIGEQFGPATFVYNSNLNPASYNHHSVPASLLSLYQADLLCTEQETLV